MRVVFGSGGWPNGIAVDCSGRLFDDEAMMDDETVVG
jgi:hypothetical protein